MENVTVTSRARWTFQEILPLVITFGIGLVGLFFGITGYFIIGGAVMTAVAGFGLFLFLIYTNLKRKRKSTLFAVLGNDKNFNIEVWMKKPMKDKWLGKLDKGKNKGKLALLRNIKMETIRGTRVIVLQLQNNSPVYVPVRLAQTDAMRKYLADVVKSKGGKVAFESKANAAEFSALLAGTDYTIPAEPVKDKTIGFTPDPVAEKIAAGKTTRKTLAPVVVKPSEKIAAEKPVIQDTPVKEVETPEAEKETGTSEESPKAKRKIGYGAYKKETIDPMVAVNNAAITIDTVDDIKEDKPVTSGDILFGLDGYNSSVNIDLGSIDTPKDESK